MENGGGGVETMQFALEKDVREEAAKKLGEEKKGGGGGGVGEIEEAASGGMGKMMFGELGKRKNGDLAAVLKATTPAAMVPTLDMNDVPKEEEVVVVPPTSSIVGGDDDDDDEEESDVKVKAYDDDDDDDARGVDVKGLHVMKKKKKNMAASTTTTTTKADVTDLNETPKLELENESEVMSANETTTTRVMMHDFLQASEAKAGLNLLTSSSEKSIMPTLDVNEPPDVYNKSAQDTHHIDEEAIPLPQEGKSSSSSSSSSSSLLLNADSKMAATTAVVSEVVMKDDADEPKIGQTATRQLAEGSSKRHVDDDDVNDDDVAMAAGDDGLMKADMTMPSEKTELEREMELFEASERAEQARLLERGDDMYSGKNELLNEKKRALESPLQERQRKQSRRLHAPDEKRKDEEDVCFICFDGGDLVLCDRRSCPKAYHLSCIGRDAAFFKKKGAWLCGWHFCSVCTKPGSFQCYTCPTAYCGSCINEAEFLLLRKRKGLCEECLPIVSMIERNETINAEGVEVDFDDQETYECLFKEYWVDLKSKLSLIIPELDKDGKAVEGNNAVLQNGGSDTEDHSENDESGADTDKESDHDDLETLDSSRRKRIKRKSVTLDSENFEGDAEQEDVEDDDEDYDKREVQPREIDGWASKELLDFIEYMKEDRAKPLTKFAVNKLLLVYIKRHKLQDSRTKSQINCDERLQKIFGKESIGQFEMFKHLQAHYPEKGPVGSKKEKEDLNGDDLMLEDDPSAADNVDSKLSRGKDRRRSRRSIDEKFERPDSNDYVAITPKNIGLIYLRRALLEDLLDDAEFENKVVDTFVRIRVPGMSSKSEMCYRLVLVTGTRVQPETYKAGRRSTNIVLEILNLQKKEDVTVDLVSNQDFTEEECQRLRQSIKCGFIKILTVGQLEEKAIALREAKVNDWFETERQRLINLRDRASEKGRKKELRECVEKLQELSSPAFRAAKLQARPEVTADPHMDPDYESDVNENKPIQDGYPSSRTRISPSIPWDRSIGSAVGSWDTPKNEEAGYPSRKGDWDSQRTKPSSTWDDALRTKSWGRGGYEPSRSSDRTVYGRDYSIDEEKPYSTDERDRSRSWDKDWEKDHPRDQDRDRDSSRWKSNGGRGRSDPWTGGDIPESKYSRSEYRAATTPVFGQSRSDWAGSKKDVVSSGTPLATSSLLYGVTPQQSAPSQAVLEEKKMWHYQDPTGTVQGPFSMEQLRKWNTTGLFPLTLTIWKTGQARETAILLTEALAGRAVKQDRDSWTTAAGAGSRARDVVGNSPTVWGGDAGLYAESHSRGELSQSTRVVDWDSRDPIDDHRGTSWGRNQSNTASYGTSPSVSGRAADDWGSSRSRGDNENWGSPPRKGDDSGKSSGRITYGRSGSGRDYDPSSGGRDAPRSTKGPRGSKKDVPCRFFAKGYCKRGEACEFWHG